MSEKDSSYERIYNKWLAVQRISNGRVAPADRESLLAFVEEPFKQAVGVLYDKNVLTIGSSCNITDFSRGSAWISLDGVTLSLANETVVVNYPHSERTFINGLDTPIIGLHFPISETDDPFDVGMRALELARQFEVQAFSWVSKWTLDEARGYFMHDSIDLRSCDQQDLVNLLAAAGYYFDSDGGVFYMSEEQFKKDQDAPVSTNS